MDDRLIVAIDGGGSGSRALAYSLSTMAFALYRGPPLNYAVLGSETFVENLRMLLKPIFEDFAASIEGYVFSLAGVSAYKDEVQRLLEAELCTSRLWLLTDIEATYLAATLGRDAIVVSAGTGSFAYGRRGNREARVGGWGYLYGDEGSAFWIGRELVRRALMYHDGRLTVGQASLRLLLNALEAESIEGALAKLYREYTQPSRVAELAKIACRAAELGCELACQLIEDAAQQLDEMVTTVAHRLGFQSDLLVHGTGGTLMGCKPLAEALRRRIESRPGWKFEVRAAQPILGCIVHYLKTVESLSSDELEAISARIPDLYPDRDEDPSTAGSHCMCSKRYFAAN